MNEPRIPPKSCEPALSAAELAQLRQDAADARTFALRLLFVDPSTHAPETAEAMDRWRKRLMDDETLGSGCDFSSNSAEGFYR